MTAPSANARAGFLIGLLAAVFSYGLIRLFEVRFAAGDVYPDYSSLRSNPTGAKLLFDALARTPGVVVTRNYLPLEYLEETNATVFLLALDAAAFAADPEPYLDNVERLAKRGNRVVAALNGDGRGKPANAGELAKRWHVQFGFDAARNRPHSLYFTEAPEWRVLDRDGPKLLALERSFEKGSVVLVSGSEDFANQSTAALDRLGLVSAALGPATRVVFDESHFGIAESGSVIGLARRFRLTGMAAGLALCAALFIWKNAAGFPPPAAAPRAETLPGRTSLSGLFTLLRRHIKPADLASACWNEWLAGNRAGVTPARMARAQAILRDRAGRPIDAVREIQIVLQSKGPL
jgi:hypothetical protein